MRGTDALLFLTVAEAAQLGDHLWDKPPGGFVDVGRMLAQPGDIVIDIAALEEEPADA